MEEINLSQHTRRVMIAMTLGLPFIGWLLGSLINPSGWMSGNLNVVFFILVFIPLHYWYISIPVLIVIIALLIQRKKDVATVMVFVISFAAALYLLSTTATASENEFAG